MANEKFIIVTSNVQFHINIRNLLVPAGYLFLANSNDAGTFLRMMRMYGPDFVIIDTECIDREVNRSIETIDDELLCPVILIGDNNRFDSNGLLDKTLVVSECLPKMDKSILVATIDVSILYFKRVQNLMKKLKEATDNYETRKLVERAKWILMERYNITEKDAYERMRKKSMDSRLSMKQIANAIIFTNEIKD